MERRSSLSIVVSFKARHKKEDCKCNPLSTTDLSIRKKPRTGHHRLNFQFYILVHADQKLF